MKIRTLYLAPMLALLLASAAFLQQAYDSRIDYFSTRHTLISLPSGNALRILSFGYDNLLADLLHIWAIQFYSTTWISNRFDYLEKIFNAITDLSPHYLDAYTTGTLIMADEKKDFPMAIRLLEKGAKENPDNWYFYTWAAFYASRGLGDYAKAAQYYAIAAKKPDAPPYVKIAAGHQIYMANDNATAWDVWMQIYSDPTKSAFKRSAFSHLFQIKSEEDIPLIKEKIAEFKNRFNRFPVSLNELLTQRLLRQIPRDFSGYDYVYDPQTGEVRPIREFRWKRSQ